MFTWIAAHWTIILAILIGVYEVVARIVPTVGTWSILAWIIKLLKWISDSTDRSK